MPPRAHTLVDPRFPAELARMRRERGLSLRDVARLAYVGKSYVHDLETGRTKPSRELAEHLDGALRAGGTLAALVVAVPKVTTLDDDERLAYVVAAPSRLDASTVRILGDVLAAQRRLDDVLSASVTLPGVVAQWRTAHMLAEQAGGPHADLLHEVVAEWTQFVGWLHAEARNDGEAVRVLTEAADQADAVDSGPLAAQVENFRGYLERQRGNPRGIVRHFLAAYQTPGATALQRVGDAVQAAHGYALLGDRDAAARLLGEASDLTEAAENEQAPVLAYWLTPTFSRMGLGLAYLALGDTTAGIDNLRAGLAGLPPDQQDALWAQEYRSALAVAAG
ncbi:helix-turn-helix domain-containing protein [Micromonospora craniellae]|uniref:XRE family transcriptional regulator n=1 Tax=Micromonospora craniellae TaxID=2294034 RepID=A0A372G0F9_9ACTN|nr:helix-turn-helix transcriptional regulator [Micromonospora craniellae]QOC94573.1 helix-turn-helix transcriptional regulator [Micromonospora craniellae]RFS46364.1 XRE family transcriptional regulator [Micromonospora craniellae]